MEERRHLSDRVASAIAPAKFVFVEGPAGWGQVVWENMTAVGHEEAAEAWLKAELRTISGNPGRQGEAAVVGRRRTHQYARHTWRARPGGPDIDAP